MSKLGLWLEKHLDTLILTASAELAAKDTLRLTVEEPISSFYSALAYSADSESMIPLHAILIEWVESRSAPTDEEPVGLLPILAILKQILWSQICQIVEAQEAIELLIEAEGLFTEANNFLAKLEAEALLNDARRELSKIQTQVDRLEKTKADFISVAAHELKTPLTIIEGYTSMLRGDLRSHDAASIGMMVSGISSGMGRLRDVVEDMIDVSLIENRLLELHYQPLWLHLAIDQVCYDLSEAIHLRRMTVIRGEELINKMTYGDAERLHQVFIKVITNAIKYTPDGGTITITGRELPGFTDVQVTDSGIGISTENLPHIFEKFSSMGNVATHSSGKIKFKGGGPGLGLAIAKGMLEAHGGSIWAESPGYNEKTLPGSTFHLMVPMRSVPPDERLAELYKVQPKLKTSEIILSEIQLNSTEA